MAMEVIPAVDLSGGRVVRLLQGDYGRVTGFDETPDEAADRFSLAGAGWLHVIDLDAARDGERSPEHAAVLERLARRRGTRLQVGGGFRSAEQVEAALAAGVQRVLIGTLAARPRCRGGAGRAVRPAHLRVRRRARRHGAHRRLARGRRRVGERVRRALHGARRGGLPGHGDRARRHAGRPRPAPAGRRPRRHRRRPARRGRLRGARARRRGARRGLRRRGRRPRPLRRLAQP